MIPGWTVFAIACLYMGGLFAIASYADRRAELGRSIINNPYVYALSLAVYCTAWTFYGSVGRAATTGIGFLPIYIGPTLAAAIWWFVMRKIIVISKMNHITSIADFIASRYGKSTLLGSLVTIIAVMGIVPYISLQLKAVSTSFLLMWSYPETSTSNPVGIFTMLDTPFYVAMLLAAFAVLFGARHLDVTEHHEGLVAAIAFESIVKLVAFLAVGIFVTFGLYNGFGDIFQRATAVPEMAQLMTADALPGGYISWASLTILSMLAIIFLPRQFQMAVIENMDESHLNKAMWLFPLYLVAINIFVLPIAFGGLLRFQGIGIDADTFVLTLPLAAGRADIAVLAFIGGLSAATSMVIVATVALSTMVSNDLVMPQLLRIRRLRLTERSDLSGLILSIRRVTIVGILLLSYGYFRVTGESGTLVSIGLISFAAVAQFAPAMLGGIFWKEGSRLGAVAGLILGFVIWGYTLPMPTLVSSGLVPAELITAGPWGNSFLRPYNLFGLEGLDPISHSLFWSLLFNTGAYVVVSMMWGQSAIEHAQASLFVDVYKRSAGSEPWDLWRGEASVQSLHVLLQRFLGNNRADAQLRLFAQRRGQTLEELLAGEPSGDLVNYIETQLSGAIGAASAHAAIASVTEEEPISNEEVIQVLTEASQLLAYSRELEQRTDQLQAKSQALEAATQELRSANERLQELDRMKDDFISTVTHELRTPLTSIRAFTEILHDNPALPRPQRSNFLEIVLKESERLSRLINQVLDFSALEAGSAEWHPVPVNMNELIRNAGESMGQLIREKEMALHLHLPTYVPEIVVDADRVTQVLINLLSNAVKFCEQGKGQIIVELNLRPNWLQVDVRDNGPGIAPAEQKTIFDKFRRLGGDENAQAHGTGLGLPISQRIIANCGGELWVHSTLGRGATFSFTLPTRPAAQHPDAINGRAANGRAVNGLANGTGVAAGTNRANGSTYDSAKGYQAMSAENTSANR